MRQHRERPLGGWIFLSPVSIVSLVVTKHVADVDLCGLGDAQDIAGLSRCPSPCRPRLLHPHGGAPGSLETHSPWSGPGHPDGHIRCADRSVHGTRQAVNQRGVCWSKGTHTLSPSGDKASCLRFLLVTRILSKDRFLPKPISADVPFTLTEPPGDLGISEPIRSSDTNSNDPIALALSGTSLQLGCKIIMDSFPAVPQVDLADKLHSTRTTMGAKYPSRE
jgi:hypothetical protein